MPPPILESPTSDWRLRKLRMVHGDRFVPPVPRFQITADVCRFVRREGLLGGLHESVHPCLPQTLADLRTRVRIL